MQAAKCYRSAERVQRGALMLSYLDQAKKWELMARRLDADEIPQRKLAGIIDCVKVVEPEGI